MFWCRFSSDVLTNLDDGDTQVWEMKFDLKSWKVISLTENISVHFYIFLGFKARLYSFVK